MMDGSEGEALSVECTSGSSFGDIGCPIFDVPLGQYTVNANAVSLDGATVPLNVGFGLPTEVVEVEMSSSALLQFLWRGAR